MEEMLGEMTVGHMFAWGPREEDDEHVKGGLLGADCKVENDRYRLAASNFNRYYFAQTGKEGAVIDERFNEGGLLADCFTIAMISCYKES